MDEFNNQFRHFKFGLYARKSSEDKNRQIQSIESQLVVLKETAKREGLTIIDVYSDCASAHKPSNRPAFANMLADLNAGKIDAILCWKADRLARNHIEGGTLMHCLETRIIKAIKTPYKTFLPTDNSLPLTIEFGMANQYSRDLSLNVKRGNKTKTENGGFCHLAPQGYINNKLEKTIEVDKERFPLLRKMWDMGLSGDYSIQQICEIASTQWGYRTPLKKRRGGNPLAVSTLHGIFTNPFYMGMVRNGSHINKGKHKPMVSAIEFERMQEIMNKKGRKGDVTYEFSLTGCISCGECGQCITAEQKISYSCPKCRTKQSSKNNIDCRKCGYSLTENERKRANKYTYYRCRKKKVEGRPKCKQKCIRGENLEQMVSDYISEYEISQDYVDFIKNGLLFIKDQNDTLNQDTLEALEQELKKIKGRQSRLLDMHLDGDISKSQFEQKKDELEMRSSKIMTEVLRERSNQKSWLDSSFEDLDFIFLLKKKWDSGSKRDKKTVFKKLCSNPSLKDGKLDIDLKPIFLEHKSTHVEFSMVLETASNPSERKKSLSFDKGNTVWWARLEAIRNFYIKKRA